MAIMMTWKLFRIDVAMTWQDVMQPMLYDMHMIFLDFFIKIGNN